MKLVLEKVELWSCPDCGFSFDSSHEDVNGGYSCPCCAELTLIKQLTEAKEIIRQLLPEEITNRCEIHRARGFLKK